MPDLLWNKLFLVDLKDQKHHFRQKFLYSRKLVNNYPDVFHHVVVLKLKIDLEDQAD